MCDVCDKTEMVGVVSSSFGPVSLAYCKECLEKPADAEFIFQYLYNDVGDRGEGLVKELDKFYTWREGAYISWSEYKRLSQEGVIPQLGPSNPDINIIEGKDQ